MLLSEAIALAKERLALIYNKEEANAITIRLCSHYFGISSTEFYTNKGLEPNEFQLKSFTSALDKLQEHCPFQYALGETSFYGLTFKVNRNVLIPRPETEELVDWIYKDFRSCNSSLNILDIGTGSGAIAISLARYLPSANFTAIDISTEALKVAKTNADLNKVATHFLEDDIFTPSTKLSNQIFDIIVSNPPYVRESEKRLMNANVLDFEPASALFVPDNDSLKYYQAIANFATNGLASKGTVYLEINEAFADETMALFSKEKYTVILRKDLSGKDRMLKVIKL
ncbi:MAG: peptide chain release factor N(5)-glutamine methyltransferase [Prevotellaceae bacterium]|jgi:release factor glutamine methyltransferase|nr:peptide chain release factor N(5)-glutamine methyltransferase [Prevotellaceae bacterium]